MIGFLSVPEQTAEAQSLFDEDVSELGYVMNSSKLWAYQPGTVGGLFDLMRKTTSANRLSVRQRGILVAACASTLGDSYCSLAWGSKLAQASDAQTASGVLRGQDDTLTPAELAMAVWARKVARDPNRTSAADVQELRAQENYGARQVKLAPLPASRGSRSCRTGPHVVGHRQRPRTSSSMGLLPSITARSPRRSRA